MNKFDCLHEKVYDFFMEKKTRDEYRREQFKTKYNFKPYDKTNPNEGTIRVNGKTYDIDMGKSKLIEDSYGDKVERETQSETDTGKIWLDNNFFKLKNNKRRDGVLNHELGHLKMHSIDPYADHTDKNFITMTQYGNDRRDAFRYEVKKRKLEKVTKQDRDSINKQLDYLDSFEDYPKIAKNNSKNNKISKERDKVVNHIRKYENPKHRHLNTTEFEADRYAANKTSSKDFKKALRETSKHTFNNYKKENKLSKEEILRRRKKDELDNKVRNTVLKDKILKDSKIYK